LRPKNKILLVTQRRDFGKDILSQGQILSSQIKKWNVGHPFWKSLSNSNIARQPIGANQTFG
jgi:hypothetical protein